MASSYESPVGGGFNAAKNLRPVSHHAPPPPPSGSSPIVTAKKSLSAVTLSTKMRMISQIIKETTKSRIWTRASTLSCPPQPNPPPRRLLLCLLLLPPRRRRTITIAIAKTIAIATTKDQVPGSVRSAIVQIFPPKFCGARIAAAAARKMRPSNS